MILTITYLVVALLHPAHPTVVATFKPAQPTVVATWQQKPVQGVELQPAHLTIVKTWGVQ